MKRLLLTVVWKFTLAGALAGLLAGLLMNMLASAATITNPVNIGIVWNANPSAQKVTSYDVYQSMNGGAFLKIATTPTNMPVVSLTGGSNYSFYVRAVNGTGPAIPSVTITTNLPPPPPPLPLPTAATGIQFTK